MYDVKHLEPVPKELDYVKTVIAPKSMPDATSIVEPLDVVDLNIDSSIKKQVSVISKLSLDEKENLAALLKEYSDVFAWKYKDMPRLNLKMVSHALNICPGSKSVK